MLMNWKNSVKMSIPPKVIYRSNAIPTVIPPALKIEKKNPNIFLERQKPLNKAILTKKGRAVTFLTSNYTTKL